MAITDPTDITGLVFWGDADVITENPAGFCEIMDNQEGTASEDINQSVSGDRPAVVTVFGTDSIDRVLHGLSQCRTRSIESSTHSRTRCVVESPSRGFYSHRQVKHRVRTTDVC